MARLAAHEFSEAARGRQPQTKAAADLLAVVGALDVILEEARQVGGRYADPVIDHPDPRLSLTAPCADEQAVGFGVPDDVAHQVIQRTFREDPVAPGDQPGLHRADLKVCQPRRGFLHFGDPRDQGAQGHGLAAGFDAAGLKS